jgi:ankyrin repeat protein
MSPELTKLFLDLGADPNIVDEMGQTPSIILCRTFSNISPDVRYELKIKRIIYFIFH